MTVSVTIYEGIKYIRGRGRGRVFERILTDVESWKIVGGKEAEEVEKKIFNIDSDELHEYLILSFADGAIGTFRYSHTDLKILSDEVNYDYNKE